MHVWPNPASDELNIQLSPEYSGGNCTIVNMLGETVYSTTIGVPGTVQINTAAWAPGVYMVSAGTGDQQASARIVIQ